MVSQRFMKHSIDFKNPDFRYQLLPLSTYHSAFERVWWRKHQFFWSIFFAKNEGTLYDTGLIIRLSIVLLLSISPIISYICVTIKNKKHSEINIKFLEGYTSFQCQTLLLFTGFRKNYCEITNCNCI